MFKEEGNEGELLMPSCVGEEGKSPEEELWLEAESCLVRPAYPISEEKSGGSRDRKKLF